ncbi:MAG: hypothetical protein E7484_02840 [Ruminococcaceae bacterium]|nr:hypothetical protein [Oscillospiraceae bacterium]
MKNFINTAKVEYTVNGQRRQCPSNSWVITAIPADNTLRGRVIANNNCKKWVLNLINKTSGNLVYSMQGVHSRSFSFNVNPDKEYIVIFSADSCCTLRLYNTPEAVTDIRWNN